MDNVVLSHDVFCIRCAADDINLALNKAAAHQSSKNDHWLAGRAVDGDSDTESCTNVHLHPWWSVDLGAAYDVGRVTVTSGVVTYSGK